MPDGIDTSVYKNQPDPLGAAGKVFGLLNANQTLQLGQQAQQIRQFELDQAQANDLRAAVGPLANVPGVTRAQVLATMAQRARQMNMSPRVVFQAAQPFLDPTISGDNLQKVLTIQGVGAIGPGAATQRQEIVDPQTGARTSVPAPQTFGKPIGAGLGPAATAAAGTAGTAAGAVLGNEATNQADYRRQVIPLERAIPALEKLGKTGTGPGTEELNQIKSFLQSMGAPGIDVNKIKNFDEANKYLTDWVRANGDTSTNDKLAASFSSNASVHISNAAAVDVAKTALAIRRMKFMQLQEFYKTGLTPDQFPQWASKWNALHDPRAFGFDHLTVEQRKKVIQSLSPAKRAQFMVDVDAADRAGVLTNQ